MKKILRLLVLLLGVLMLPAAAHAQNAYGDVNNDGEVNVADVNAVINVVLSSGSLSSADVNGDGEINIADVNTVIDIILNGGVQPEPELAYVDLGLPSGTLWATRNVGAGKPEDYGDYFAWGETEPKETYSWSTYKWCENQWSMTKYDPTAWWKYDEIELEPEDDAATVNWGPQWCMPTEGQMEELCSSCTWQFTQRNGVNGSLATGPNGNTLFFPAAGRRSNSSLNNAGSSGYYWSGTVDYNTSSEAFYMACYSNTANCLSYYYYGRSVGYTVRPVRVPAADEKPLYIEQSGLDLGEVPVGATRTGELTIINNSDEDAILSVAVDEPFLLKDEEGSASDLLIEVPGNSIAPVTVTFKADATGDFNGNVTFEGDALEGGVSVVPVQVRAVGNMAEHEYVDLGLPSHTRWATCNIGASNPEDRGDYFAWGETKPKDYYGWNTYKWYKSGPNGSGFTKYCLDGENGYNGFADGKNELDRADDAATVNWGPQWRMPTYEQLEELYDYCSRSWTQMNGVTGLLLTGPNGYKLFLPTTGIRVGSHVYNTSFDGNIWSSSLNDEDARDAIFLAYYSDDWYLYYEKRCYGYTIRPVRAQ